MLISQRYECHIASMTKKNIYIFHNLLRGRRKKTKTVCISHAHFPPEESTHIE